MTLILDDRERDIHPVISKLDVPVTVCHLEFADSMWEGCGPDRSSVLVGCERKKLGDLVTSMKDRRLSGHQLRGMSQAYDYRFLFTEGQWRPGPSGEIEEWKYDPRTKKFGWVAFYKNGCVGDRSAISYQQIMGYVTGLELRGNVVWRKTRDMAETAAQLVGLYKNFQKPWDQHHSHDQVYSNGVLPVKGHGSEWGQDHTHDPDYGKYGRGRVTLIQADPSTLWRMAAQLPGVDRKAEVVASHFKTVRAMLAADEKEWMSIDFGFNTDAGKRNPGIGKVTARAILKALNEEGA